MSTSRLALALVLLSLLAIPAQASGRGSSEEARALAERAAAFLRAHGKQTAYAAFSDGDGFVDRDLYVFVLDPSGILLAHGNNPAIVGKSIWRLKDVDGQLITQNAIGIALERGTGWTSAYRFPDPVTKRLGVKRSYVILVEDVVVGVGFFSAN